MDCTLIFYKEGIKWRIPKKKIKKLYEGKPVIRISVTQSRPRVSVKRGACTIIGVCLHVFCVEENAHGIVEKHSIRHADVLSKQIETDPLQTLW